MHSYARSRRRGMVGRLLSSSLTLALQRTHGRYRCGPAAGSQVSRVAFVTICSPAEERVALDTHARSTPRTRAESRARSPLNAVALDATRTLPQTF